MASALLRDAEEHHPVAWALQSFTVNHDHKSTGPSQLYLDRANGQFGVVYQSQLAVTTLAQFPDDEPVYLEGKCARAAAWRPKCKKISLLFQHAQLDLEFASVDQAHSFLHMVEDIVMAAGNRFFHSYDVPL
jgi:histone acetyltransferase HTATIP